MPNVNRGPAQADSLNVEAALTTQPPTALTTFSTLTADGQTTPGTLAYTSDQGWCFWNASAWVPLVTVLSSIALANGTSITLNCLYAQNYTVNTRGAGTLTVVNPTGTPVEGQRLTLRIKSSNVQTYSWGSQYRGSSTAALPTASTGSAKNDYIGFIWNSTDSYWDFVSSVTGF